MNYQETVDFLFNQFPAYQKHGGSAFKPGLERVNALSALANNPHHKFKSIHLAGTNGKGSCSSMLASIMQEAGYKVGLFTSPHLKNFKERIKINGQEIEEDFVVHFVKRFEFEAKNIAPSFFEYTTIMAFEYFATQKVDVAIIETGLGGRLDCSNIVEPELSIITNIGLDHTQFLGNTLSEIAIEKAGIIKRNTPVVIGRTQSETTAVFKKIANAAGATVYFAEQEQTDTLFASDLKGIYQKENISTVRTAVQVLQKLNWNISKLHIENGFKSVIKNTGLKGRWQILQQNPTVICDTGHNEDGVKQIIKQLHEIPKNKLHIVWGMANDKDVAKILGLLPNNAQYYWCAPQNPRALKTDTLLEAGAQLGLDGGIYASINKAIEAAKKTAQINDLIFIGGSTFVVAEIEGL